MSIKILFEGCDFFHFPPDPWENAADAPTKWFEQNFESFIYTPNHIKKNSVIYEPKGVSTCGGIYFLLLNNKICYVGKATDISQRLRAHKKEGKKFTHYWCFGGMPETFLSAIEGYYIHSFEPVLNCSYPPIHIIVQPYIKKQKQECDEALGSFTHEEAMAVAAKLD